MTQTVVGIADAAAHIQDIVRDEAAKTKAATQASDNEFNIRKNFLDNAVDALQKATLGQYNIVICTDQAHDDFQDLVGRILPMDLLNLEIAQGKFVNFEVYVFDTGKYLRHGKYERDHWWYWGESKKFFDPAAMHVHFERAQTKLNPDEAKKAQDAAAAAAKTAADAAAAEKAAQEKAKANEAETLKKEAEQKVKDAQAAAAGGAVGGADGITPYNGPPDLSSSYPNDPTTYAGAPGSMSTAIPNGGTASAGAAGTGGSNYAFPPDPATTALGQQQYTQGTSIAFHSLL